MDFVQENDKSMLAVETRHINTRTLNGSCLRICFARYLEAVAVTNERLASNAVKCYGTGNSGTEEQRNTTKVSGVEPDVKAERNTVSVVCFVQLLIAKRNLCRGDCSGNAT